MTRLVPLSPDSIQIIPDLITKLLNLVTVVTDFKVIPRTIFTIIKNIRPDSQTQLPLWLRTTFPIVSPRSRYVMSNHMAKNHVAKMW